jgi:hypothetical protein
VALLSNEVEHSLKAHGIPSVIHVGVLGCDDAVPVLSRIVGAKSVHTFATVDDAVRAARSHRLLTIVAGGEIAPTLLRTLGAESLSVGVIGYVPDGATMSPAMLRSFGIMEVIRDFEEANLSPILRRGLDFRALLALELAHRCESKRLHQRELELLGHPPETMSDDLNTFQPPPLPVGPLSTYNLDEASDAFEKAYIDRVQHLCASAREAAVYLGVSSATLSRRLRRENMVHGE